ncbi:tetratricopeptide repeat-containing sensor histidine kinase [Marinoscillum sp.]|uniref:tetratricopeptide repeat-containing sensor histidine kinase n=1 Tax=Marinoscillum sp. TaxID=2024838 RepID=UPI003BAC1A11
MDDPSIGGTLNNLGLVAERLGLLEEAIDYYKQGIALKRENGQHSNLGTSYLNLGVVWRLLKNYDSAIYYGLIAKDNFEQQDDRKGQADALNNLALNYFDKNRVDLAFSYARQSLEIKRDLGDEYGMMNTYQNLSIYLMSGGDPTRARMYSDSSIHLAQKNSALAQERSAYIHIARIDSARGDYLEAFEWMKKAYRLQYEIYDSEVTNRISELETQYETAQKEQEIERLSQENELIQLRAEQTEQERLILVLSLLFLVVIVVTIFFFYRSKEKSNKQLKEANHQLAQLNQTKDKLFSIISHDLKSPLSSFHLITKSLTDNWDNLEKDQLKDFLITLRDSSANVRDMMDNLLKWALAQTDQLQFSPDSIDPSEIITAVKKQLIPVAQLKKMEIHVAQQEALNIHADKAFLEIVIRNLVSNALKYSDVEKNVEVSVESTEDRGVITIQDEGVGMDQSQIDSLLNGSLIAHDIQNSPEKGTGLGLLLCKELVDRMNGKLEVQSKINEGTTFRISFPKAA